MNPYILPLDFFINSCLYISTLSKIKRLSLDCQHQLKGTANEFDFRDADPLYPVLAIHRGGVDALAGVRISEEVRCSEYDSDDYRYSQSLEAAIVAQQGGRIYEPYSGRYFESTRETDIEHIVARSEAHDSGPCARPVEDRATVRDVKRKWGLSMDREEARAIREVLAGCDSVEIDYGD